VPVHRFADEARLLWMNRRTFWTSTNRQAFYVNGSYDARVPAGLYELILTRGPEYRLVRRKVDVRANETTTVGIALERYADLPGSGWYSGDSHIHLMRDAPADLAIWGQLAAEDVHVGNLLEMGNIEGTYFKQPAWDRAGQFRARRLRARARPGGSADRHARPHDPLESEVARALREGSVLPVRPRLRADAEPGRVDRLRAPWRAVSTDVAVRARRAVRPGRFHRSSAGRPLNTDVWYSFLNLGFKVLPVGGADFPYFGPTLPGVERTYVKPRWAEQTFFSAGACSAASSTTASYGSARCATRIGLLKLAAPVVDAQ